MQPVVLRRTPKCACTHSSGLDWGRIIATMGREKACSRHAARDITNPQMLSLQHTAIGVVTRARVMSRTDAWNSLSQYICDPRDGNRQCALATGMVSPLFNSEEVTHISPLPSLRVAAGRLGLARMSWLFGSTSPEGVGQTVAFGKRRIKLQRQLAEGGYAVVFEGVDARTRERHAVKRIITADEESRDRAEHEVAIHEQLGSEVTRHLVGYHGCARLPRRDGGLDVFLLLEFCAGGHLWAWCTRDGASAMGARQRLTTLAQVADGLAALHALPLAHNDLKLENVLVRCTRYAYTQMHTWPCGGRHPIPVVPRSPACSMMQP